MSRLEVDVRLRYSTGFEVAAAFATERLVTGLVGPSGSGKTSVLSMIAGLRTPDVGRIMVDGAVLFDSKAGVNVVPERRRVGYVFQSSLLFPHLTVRDNLLFGARRSATKTDERATAEVIELLELRDLVGRLPHTLSGGQQRRVALGRAVLMQPRLLLLDEPLSSLDVESAEQVLRLLARLLAQHSIPTIYVTHNETELARFDAASVRMQGGGVRE